MAIIRNTRFHLWISQNDKYIERLRQDFQAATGKEMEFDTYVEFFFNQSKANDQELPSREELVYMCWLADNRTLLGKGHATMIEGEKNEKILSRFNHNMYVKTEQGEKDLSEFIK